MRPCFCRAILAVLVIFFAWWQVSWGQIALTVLGALLAIMALTGNKCCCSPKTEVVQEKVEEADKPKKNNV